MIKTAVSMFLVIGICQQDDKLAGDDDVERKIQGQLGATNPVYASEFEGPFLDATRTFYRAKAEQWLYEDSMSEYLQKVCRRGAPFAVVVTCMVTVFRRRWSRCTTRKDPVWMRTCTRPPNPS